MTLWGVFLLLLFSMEIFANLPTFDEASRMRVLLLPTTTKIGSIIYRLRAADPDFDYPLTFDVLGVVGRSLISLEAMNCTKRNTVCEADVILRKELEVGRTYDLNLTVQDTKGGKTTVPATIQGTTGSTPVSETFPSMNNNIFVPENTPVGSLLEVIIAKKNMNNSRGVFMELRGSSKFRLGERLSASDRSNGSIYLNENLDFEQQSMYTLRLLAMNAYVNMKTDTRNAVELNMTVIVIDVQDTPPVFTIAPPVTSIPESLTPGSFVLHVHAEDGDKGGPREIRYGLVSDSSPFAPFFNMNSKTGDLTLRKPLKELTAMVRPNTPFLLTIVAEEVTTEVGDISAMTTTVNVALIVQDENNDAPQFGSTRYTVRMDEGASIGTALQFTDPQTAFVADNDQGQNGIFALSVMGDNGTFDISPAVAENTAHFVIRVKNPANLHYEINKDISFQIVAKEVQQGSTKSSTANVVVYLNDINDNSPVFSQNPYTAEIMENSPPGTTVVQVSATDVDTGRYGAIRYTKITGEHASVFNLDPVTGLVTVTSSTELDREVSPEITLTVEARDEEGNGRASLATLIVKLKDANDNPPRFSESLYEASVTPDLTRLTSKLVVQAIDIDGQGPNSDVRYEIVSGNYESKFRINEKTGEIALVSPLSQENIEPVITLHVRAYDLGVPHMNSDVPVQIYTQEITSRNIYFILPRSVSEIERNRRSIETMLSALTGAPTAIQSVQPYNTNSPGVNALAEEFGSALATRGAAETNGDSSIPKSRVTATVRFPSSAATVDIERIQSELLSSASFGGATISKMEEYEYKNSVLFWVLVTLAVILLLTVLIMLICCLCPSCWCYKDSCRKTKSRKISAGESGVNGVILGEKDIIDMNYEGKPPSSKAASIGRREAWSGEQGQYLSLPRRGKNSIQSDKSRRRRESDNRVTSFRDDDRAGQNSYRNMYLEDLDAEDRESRLANRERSPRRIVLGINDDRQRQTRLNREWESRSDGQFGRPVRDRKGSFHQIGNAEVIRFEEEERRAKFQRSNSDSQLSPDLQRETLKGPRSVDNANDRYQVVQYVDGRDERDGKEIIMSRFMQDQSLDNGPPSHRQPNGWIPSDNSQAINEDQYADRRRHGVHELANSRLQDDRNRDFETSRPKINVRSPILEETESVMALEMASRAGRKTSDNQAQQGMHRTFRQTSQEVERITQLDDSDKPTRNTPPKSERMMDASHANHINDLNNSQSSKDLQLNNIGTKSSPNTNTVPIDMQILAGGKSNVTSDTEKSSSTAKNNNSDSTKTSRRALISGVNSDGEQDHPYFNNRSSMLRHKKAVARNKIDPPHSHNHNSKTQNGKDEGGEEPHDHPISQSNSRRNSLSRQNGAAFVHANKTRSNTDVTTTVTQTEQNPGEPLEVEMSDGVLNSTAEDDLDSGIMVNGVNPPKNKRYMEKKSVFTILYDMQTTRLPPTTAQVN